MRMRIFTPVGRAAVRRPPDARHGVRARRAAAARRDPARDRRGERCRCALEREGARIVFGWMEQPMPTVDAVRRARTSCSPRSASSRSCRSSSTTTACRTCSSRSARARQVAALAPDSAAARSRSAPTASTASPATARGGRRGCSAPALGVAEDPATGSAAGPLALHLARHGRIAFGDEIEIEQGVEIGRPSKLLRARRRHGRRGRAHRGRRLRRHRRARRVPF